jgi:hypothetical protein
MRNRCLPRFILSLIIWKALNRLLEPTKAALRHKLLVPSRDSSGSSRRHYSRPRSAMGSRMKLVYKIA